MEGAIQLADRSGGALVVESDNSAQIRLPQPAHFRDDGESGDLEAFQPRLKRIPGFRGM